MSHRHPSSEFNAVKNMPPLRHSVGGKFNVDSSEVVQWLLAQPDLKTHVMNHMFHTCKASGFIVYHNATGTWQGRDYRKPSAPPTPPPIVF